MNPRNGNEHRNKSNNTLAMSVPHVINTERDFVLSNQIFQYTRCITPSGAEARGGGGYILI